MKWLAAIIIGAALLAGCGSNTSQASKTAAAVSTAALTGTPKPTDIPATPTQTAIPPTATPAPKVLLSENGFNSYTDSLGNIYVVWAAVLQNASSQQALSTTATALFYDAANLLLKTDTSRAALMFPGQTTAVGSTFLQATSVPSRMEVRVSGTTFQESKTAENFEVTGAVYSHSTYASKVTAQVRNPFDKDLKTLNIMCILSGPDGKYQAVGESYLDLLPSGTTGVAECSIDYRLAVSSDATARLFVNISSITSIAQ